MEKTNHPVDDIFSKGLSDFQVTPLADTKKKIFVSPAAIKPIKPWFIASKNIIIFSSTLLVSSFLFYYLFFDNSTKEIVTNNQNKIAANTIINNTASINNQKNEVVETIENKNTLPTNNTNYKEIVSETNNNIENSSNNNTPVSLSGDEDKGSSHTSNEPALSEANVLSTTNPHHKKVQDKQINTTTPPENNNSTNKTSDQTILANDVNASENNTTINKVNTQNDLNISATANIGTNSFENSNLVKQNNEGEYFSFMQKRTIPYFNNGISTEVILKNNEYDYHLKGLWFVEFKTGGIVSNYKVKGKDSEWDNAAKAKQNLLTASFGNEFQLNAIYQKANWIFKGGLSYVNYGEKIKGNALLTNPHNETNISFNNGHYDVIIGGNYYLIDTIGSYYHYTYTQTNHIFISDSVLTWRTKNVLADVYDTTQVTRFDSLPKTTLNNSIRYFEIPLSVGYVIPYGRFTVGFNATITPGYFLSVKGSNMNAELYPALEPYKKSTLTKFTLSAGAELEFGYQINEGLMLSFSPFYRKSLFPMYNSENQLNQKSSNYGFRVGIRKLL